MMIIKSLAIAIPCAGVAITWAIKKYGKSKMDERSKNLDRNPDSRSKNGLKTANKGVGLALSPEKFSTDPKEVADLLLKSHTNAGEMAHDDPQLGSLIPAWARICNVFGPEFEPYLQIVIPLVLRTVNIEPEVALLHSEVGDIVEDSMENKIAEDMKGKVIALKILATFVAGAKEDSFHADEACKLIVRNINFFDVNIRRAAVQSCSVVCQYAKYKDRKYQKKILFFILENLVDEPNKEVLLEKLDLLVVCMKAFGAKIFDPDVQIEIVRNLKKIFDIHEQNKEERSKRKDDEVTHGQLLNKIYNTLHTVLIVNEYGFDVYFHKLIKGPVNDLLTPEEPWQDQLFALRIINEVIEARGLEWDRWYSDKEKIFIEGMMEKIMKIIDCRPPAVVLEAAFHGIGLLGLHQGAIIKKLQSYPEFLTKTDFEDLKSSKLFQNLKEAAIKLEKFIEKKYSEDVEFLSAREKASHTLNILNMNIMPIAEQANTNVFVKITNIIMDVKNWSWARLS